MKKYQTNDDANKNHWPFPSYYKASSQFSEVVIKPVKQHLYVLLWKQPLCSLVKKCSVDWAYVMRNLVRAVLKDGFVCKVFTQNDFPTFMATKLFSKGMATVRLFLVKSALFICS